MVHGIRAAACSLQPAVCTDCTDAICIRYFSACQSFSHCDAHTTEGKYRLGKINFGQIDCWLGDCMAAICEKLLKILLWYGAYLSDFHLWETYHIGRLIYCVAFCTNADGFVYVRKAHLTRTRTHIHRGKLSLYCDYTKTFSRIDGAGFFKYSRTACALFWRVLLRISPNFVDRSKGIRSIFG